ncbi:MAG: NAD kinase [Paludibacter sp.]|nr:NAD kinase [Paludibacter sp.]
MKIAIFGNTYHQSTIKYLKELINFLNSIQVHILLDKSLFDCIKNDASLDFCNVNCIENDDFVCDYALSLGGDGTFLNSAARIGVKNSPILGINMGRLGFLADVLVEYMIPAVQAMLNGELQVEERTLLTVSCSDGTVIDYPYALNEISILKQDSSSMISIHTTLNGEPIHTYQADGLLVSTPTGSTAYSMSVGGPIMVPQASNFILSPVASHSLNVRPLIVPDNWIIDLEVRSRSNCYQLALDGRNTIMTEQAKLRISKADFAVKILKQPNHTFFDNLKNKLMWGVDKRN